MAPKINRLEKESGEIKSILNNQRFPNVGPSEKSKKLHEIIIKGTLPQNMFSLKTGHIGHI